MIPSQWVNNTHRLESKPQTWTQTFSGSYCYSLDQNDLEWARGLTTRFTPFTAKRMYWGVCCSLVSSLWTSCVMRRQPLNSASSLPAQSESDGGTGPSACSRTAYRTSWCRRDCSPDRGERSKHRCSAAGSEAPVTFIPQWQGFQWE